MSRLFSINPIHVDTSNLANLISRGSKLSNTEIIANWVNHLSPLQKNTRVEMWYSIYTATDNLKTAERKLLELLAEEKYISIYNNSRYLAIHSIDYVISEVIKARIAFNDANALHTKLDKEHNKPVITEDIYSSHSEERRLLGVPERG